MADIYNPLQTVAPTVGMPSDYGTVRASPANFGSQIGQALEQGGNQLGEAASFAQQVAMQRQGMLNEAMVADADSQGNKELTDIKSWYKTLEGPAAVAAHPEAEQKALQVRQKMLQTLPNEAAKRSFNLQFTRSERYALGELGEYKTVQEKRWITKSNTDTVLQAQDSFGSTTASEAEDIDNRSKIIFGAAKITQDQGYGAYALSPDGQVIDTGTGMKINEQTGRVTFNDTDTGRAAQEIYNQTLETYLGQAYANKINNYLTVDENPVKASEYLKENWDYIPTKTRASLTKLIAPVLHDQQAREVAKSNVDNALWVYEHSQEPVSLNPSASVDASDPDKVTDRFIKQESGGKGSNIGQIQPETWKEYATPNEDVSNPTDNRNVTKRILSSYLQNYKLPDGSPDLARVAVAYFSGPGNVADTSSSDPFKNDVHDSSGKSVSSYVADITGQHLSSNPLGGYNTQADYLEANEDEILLKTEAQARLLYGNNQRLVDTSIAHTKTYINDIVSRQRKQDAVDIRQLQDYVFKRLGAAGGSTRTMDILSNGPKEVQDLWNRFQESHPSEAYSFKNKVVTATSKGMNLDYGTDFWRYYEKVATGEINDPSKLWDAVGSTKNAPITPSGLDALTKVIDRINTPEGIAFAHEEKTFFDNARKLVTGSSQGAGYFDPDGDKKFSLFMQNALPKIQAGQSQGKSSKSLFDPKSPDYVGDALPSFYRLPSVAAQDMIKYMHLSDPALVVQGGQPGTSKSYDFSPLDTNTDPNQVRQILTDDIKKRALTVKEALAYTTARGWTDLTGKPVN